MIVLKIGGRALSENLEGIADDIVELVKSGHKLIVVHGGGHEIDYYTQKMNLEPKKVVSPSGVVSRYTDEEELKLVTMVLAGLVNKRIVHSLHRRGIVAMGMTGLDGMSVTGRRREKIIIVDERGRKRLIDAGFTGKIERIDASLINRLHEIFDVLVVSPLIHSEESPLNVDSDYLASQFACYLKSEYLIFLTDVDGVIVDGQVLKEISIDHVEEILPKIGKGMNRKLIHAIEAYKCGVKIS